MSYSKQIYTKILRPGSVDGHIDKSGGCYRSDAPHSQGPHSLSGSVDGHIDNKENVYRSDDPHSREESMGWYSSRNLPHFDCGRIFQVITYRLADSLPKSYLQKLKIKSGNEDNLQKRKEIEKLLDQGHGSCILRHPAIVKIIEENWLHFNGTKYDIVSGVIMPNHVHILIKVYEQVQLGKIVKSWKAYTSRKIKALLISGSVDGHIDKSEGCYRSDDRHSRGVWQRGYWDRYIRDEKHYYQTIDYILKNHKDGGILINQLNTEDFLL